MGDDEWYETIQWDIEVPCNQPDFAHSTEKSQLNDFAFFLKVSLTEKKASYKPTKALLLPKVVLKCKPLTDNGPRDCKINWKVHCSASPSSEEKKEFSYKSTTCFNKDVAEYPLDELPSYGSSCWWMDEPDTRCQMVVTLTLKSPLDKPEIVEPIPTFSEEWSHSDVVFVVEGTEVHAHRQILALSSPVFSAMLFENFKEKKSSRIELPGKTYDIFIEFLRYVYPQCNTKELQVSTALHLIGLFHEYQLVALEDKARLVLLRGLKEANAMRCLIVADLYGHNNLKHKALRALGTVSFEKLQEQKLFRNAKDHLQLLIRDARIWYLEHKKCLHCGK